MATTVTPPAASAPPSIADLRSMLSPTPTPKEPEAVVHSKEETKPETPEVPAAEPEKVATEPGTTETEPGTVPEEQAQESVAEDKDEELPEGVRKRIAKEAEKQARIQTEIARAVSARKAAQAELDKVTAEPVPPTVKKAEPAATEAKLVRPVRPAEPPTPVLGDDEKWDDHQSRLKEHREKQDAALTKYEAEMVTYENEREVRILAEAERRFRAQAEADRAASEGDKFLESAIKEHGKDVLQPAIEGFKGKTTEPFQTAISQLETWPAMVIYLDAHPDELKTITDTFAANQHRGVAALGKLEDKLSAPKPKPVEKPAVVTVPAATPLPPPPAVVGGKASPIAAIDLGKRDLPFSKFKADINRKLGKTG